MNFFLFLPLLVPAVFGVFQGNHQLDRLSDELEMVCDDLEESSGILSNTQKTLEQSAADIRRIAQEIDRVHKQATDDAIVKSGIAVGGDLIRIGAVVLDFFMMGAPIFSTVGLGISLVGGKMRHAAHAKEQDANSYYMGIAKEIFGRCKEEMKDVSDTYRRIEKRFRRLEKDERLAGTILHKKLTEIKISFPHFHAWREAMLTHDEAHSDSSRYKYEMAYQALHATAAIMGAPSKVLHFVEAFSAITSLFLDGSEMYNDMKHRDEGARSELADKLREVANYFEGVSRELEQAGHKETSMVKWLA